MRATILLILVGLAVSAKAQQTHTIVAADFQFTPDLLVVAPGDTVRLALNAGHSFRQVSRDAWLANETTPIGFYDFGPSDQLDTTHYVLLTAAPDTLYYICVPHADMGMKGRIVVSASPNGLLEVQRSMSRLIPEGRDLRLWDIWPGALARAVDLGGNSHALKVEGSLLRTAMLPTGLYIVEVTRPDGRSMLVQRVVLP